MKRKKIEKSNLAEWGKIQAEYSIQRCPKCDGNLENCNAFGVIYLGVCKKCKKFWGICIEDVTTKLLTKFKNQFLKSL